MPKRRVSTALHALVLALGAFGACGEGGEPVLIDAAPRPCNATESGCICASDATDQGLSCSADEQGDGGFCCQSIADDGGTCACVRPACWRPNDNPDFCTCGPDLHDPGDDSEVDSCERLPGQHCCVNGGGIIGALCMCSSLDCSSFQAEVLSCTRGLVADCGDEGAPVDHCD
jgi:hypothetical protein